MLKRKILISVILIILGVVTRILPHPFNFAPLAGIALFSGVYLGAVYAVAIPVGSMFAGDVVLGFYELPIMISVYASYALIGLIGLLIKKHKSVEIVLGSSLLSSFLFFFFTNGAVWFFGTWYDHNLQGLTDAFILALPFFRNTVVGDLFYTSILFGSLETVRFLFRNRKLSKAIS
ncbi:hypothetical protein C4572_02460 [Candidatus Parcubacteria bacterium]|nr:MAG: hypothetical protein C4572_02460 [Candidatus Parcubacteria bacterium]